MNGPVERILTSDGSHSLYLPQLRETYHSTHGAVQESRHVFIANGLEAWARDHGVGQTDAVMVFEVGLGTGLNALLTAEWAQEHGRTVHMVSVEAYPLEEPIWQSLNYPEKTPHPGAAAWWDQIHRSPWNEEVRVHGHFLLTKLHMKLEDFSGEPSMFNVVFYDAFAPGKQAEMWEPDQLGKAVSCMKTGGYLVTYCAQGQFKRDLETFGMRVQPLAGPPGKKEMTRAVK